MRSPLKTLFAAAVTALCLAAPSAATIDTSPPLKVTYMGKTTDAYYQVRAGGTVHAFGKIGPLASFRITVNKGARQQITFVSKKQHLSFKSLELTAIAFAPNAVRITGTGLVNGTRMVQFVAVAVTHNGNRYADRFALTWNHKARMGGALHTGDVRITPISL